MSISEALAMSRMPGEWRAAGGERPVAGGEWRVARGRWQDFGWEMRDLAAGFCVNHQWDNEQLEW
jgi:hypothetical protein